MTISKCSESATQTWKCRCNDSPLNLSCHFGIPALYEDELIIRTWVQTITAARIIFTYTVKRIEKDGSETELGYGTTEHGFVDSKTFRPTSIKKRFPKLYEDISAAVKHF